MKTSEQGESRYVIALGSNMRHHRHGSPRKVVAAALAAIEEHGIRIVRASRVMDSAPLGPSRRRYANAAALVETRLDPPGLLTVLKGIEAAFGRRSGGLAWRARVLDLDIVLWSEGAWDSPGLIVPHIAFRDRVFVLGPVCEIAPGWRDPVSGRTLRQLRSQL